MVEKKRNIIIYNYCHSGIYNPLQNASISCMTLHKVKH